MSRHYTDLVAICEEIANNHKLPSRIVDWADELYTVLLDKKGSVLVEDLQLLQAYGEDGEDGYGLKKHGSSEYAIGLIDRALSRRAS